MPAQPPTAPHHPLLPPERYFRWRAGEITRLEAFCDVVFGFAITLLVVSLEVPHSFAELKVAMRGFLPFAVCFAQFVLIWVTHYRFSRRYGLEDGYTVFLNVVLLFLVLFYVYPLKFLFTFIIGQIVDPGNVEHLNAHDATVLMQIYGVGFASVFALFVLMYHHAYALRQKLQLNAVEVLETRSTMLENLVMMLIGVLSCLVAFKDPQWAGLSYNLIGVFFFIYAPVMTRRKKKLAESLEAKAIEPADDVVPSTAAG
ncbi:MAG TPA: TMEM175 family protein [Terriglobales bacterium]